MTDENFEKGLELRRKMLGAEGADKKLEEATDFIKPLEEWVTSECFGAAWHRPILDLKTRSMLTIAMLTAGPDRAIRNSCLPFFGSESSCARLPQRTDRMPAARIPCLTATNEWASS